MAEEEITWPTHPPNFIEIGRLLQNVFLFLLCKLFLCCFSFALPWWFFRQCFRGTCAHASLVVRCIPRVPVAWIWIYLAWVCTSFVPQGFPVDWIQIRAYLSLPIYILHRVLEVWMQILTILNLELRQWNFIWLISYRQYIFISGGNTKRHSQTWFN